MVHFSDFPQEVLSTVLENLDVGSLLSTAVVSSFFQYPTERLMYYEVSFGYPMATVLPALQAFLRTVSSSERRARHVNLLRIHEFPEHEAMAETLQNLETAMKNMVNLKKLSISGTTYIRHAHLESALFSLAHLSINFCFGDDITNEYGMLLPILKAHPELRGVFVADANRWKANYDLNKLEERGSDFDEHPSAVVCPRVEYFQSNGQKITESFLVGRCIKRLIVESQRHSDLEREWGPPSIFPRYRNLETIVLHVDSYTITSNTLPAVVAQHLVSLTRLNVRWAGPVDWTRPSVQRYAPHPLLRSIAQIQTLESLTLSVPAPWCTSPSEQEDMVRFLYKSCQKLREAFIQSGLGYNLHSHYGVKGELVGTADFFEACKQDFEFDDMFF